MTPRFISAGERTTWGGPGVDIDFRTLDTTTESGGEVVAGAYTLTVQNSGNGTIGVTNGDGVVIDSDAGDYLDNTNTNALGFKISAADLIGSALGDYSRFEVAVLVDAINPASGRQGFHLGVADNKGLDEASVYGMHLNYVATTSGRCTAALWENGSRGSAQVFLGTGFRVFAMRVTPGRAWFYYSTDAADINQPDNWVELADATIGNAPTTAEVFDMSRLVVSAFASDNQTVKVERLIARSG